MCWAEERKKSHLLIERARVHHEDQHAVIAAGEHQGPARSQFEGIGIVLDRGLVLLAGGQVEPGRPDRLGARTVTGQLTKQQYSGEPGRRFGQNGSTLRSSRCR